MAEERILSYPGSLIFLMQDNCNAGCVMCGLYYGQNDKPSDITLNKYIKMIKNVGKNRIRQITFSGGGEPLLNEDFQRIVTYTRNKFANVDLYIFTNGIRLDQDKSRLLAENDFKKIVISINAAS